MSDKPTNRMAMLKLNRLEMADYLGLPHETQVINVFTEMTTNTIYVLVESPDLPEVKEGAQPPVANPVVTTTFDWGLPS